MGIVVLADFFALDFFDFGEGFAVGFEFVGLDTFFQTLFELGVVVVLDGKIDGVAESGFAPRGGNSIFEVVGLVAGGVARWPGFVHHVY